MLTKNWMTKNVITINADESMNKAAALMKQYKIKSLPVIEKEHLVGVVTNGDLKRSSASDATSLDVWEMAYLITKIKIRDIMTKKVATVHPLLTVDEAAEILLEKGIPCVPVMDDSNKLIGILTRSDILKVMISLTGMDKRGVDFGIEVVDEPGSIKSIMDTVRTYEGRIASILISYERASVGFRNVYIRVFQLDLKRLGDLKKELMKQSKLLYILDFLGRNREILI